MKRFILSIALLLSVAFSACAQRGFDLFGAPRCYVVTQPGIQLTNTGTTTYYTNAWVDVKGCQGIASMLLSATNGWGTTPKIGIVVWTSNDQTNMWVLTNCAIAVSNSMIYTNFNWYGTNVFATNSYLFPGTVTTPTTATAGFSGSYIAPLAYTNSAYVLTNSAGGVAEIGFPVDDIGRYLTVQYIVYGANASFNANAFLLSWKQLSP